MGLIPREIVSQIIDRNDIVDVVSLYLPLKKSGHNFKACCPFHNEKTPSFVVNPNKQIFHCFGCGVGGNIISFIMMHENVDFPEAARILAQKTGINIPNNSRKDQETLSVRQKIFDLNALAVNYFHKTLLSDKSKFAKKSREYLKIRGVSLDTIKKFQLGLSLDSWDELFNFFKSKKISFDLMTKAGLIIARDKGDGFYDRFRQRIIFPIFDTRVNCRAFGARALNNDSSSKYINSPETPVYIKGHHLFGFHLAKQAILDLDYVIVVEGYTDCIIPHQYGISNVVASLGTSLTVEQIRLIRRYTKNVVMLFDMDVAGESAMIRSFDMLIDEGISVKVACLSEGEDPDSFLRKYGADEFNEIISKAKGVFYYKLQYLFKKFGYKTVESKAKISGEMLPTIDKFDNAVIRSEYVKILAQKLMVSEQALIFEIKKISTGRVKSYEKKPIREKFFVDKQTRTVEKDMLKLLLDENDYVKSIKENVQLSDIQDENIRNIMSKMFDMYDKGESINIGSLMNSFEDKKVQEIISSLIAEGIDAESDKEKMHKDYIVRIKKDRFKKRRQEILTAMIEAENMGNDNKLEELKREFNQLIKQ